MNFANKRDLVDSIVACHTGLAAEHRVKERGPQQEQAEQEPAAPELAALCGTQRTATRLVQQQAEDLGCERPAPRHPRLFAITRHQSHCENKARHELVKCNTTERETHKREECTND